MKVFNRSFGEAVNMVKAEANITMAEMLTGHNPLSKSDMAAGGMTAGLVTMAMAGSTFADPKKKTDSEGGLIGRVEGQLKSYYGKLIGISTILAVFVIVVGILWIMISPTAKGAQTPLGWIKKVVVCWIVIMILGGLLGIAESVTDGQGLSEGDLDSHKPSLL